MKRMRSILLAAAMIALLCACSKQELANMTAEVQDDHAVIVWEDKVYVPYCVVSKTECGEQIGVIEGSKDNEIYAYKDYSVDEWIVDLYTIDHIAMLMRETDTTDIPDGLESEYEWNN